MALAREEFIKSAEKMGLSKDAAKKLADEYGLTAGSVDTLKESMDKIPEKVVSEIKAETKKAKADIAALQQQIDLLKGKTITINVKSGTIRATGQSSTGGFGRGFLEGNYATGGSVKGPGTGTSDSIPAWLSNGEYVVKAAAVAKYGKGMFDSLNAMRFADGGFVSRVAQAGIAGAAIDYDLLAQSMSRFAPRSLTVVSGADAQTAARVAIRDDHWRSRHGG